MAKEPTIAILTNIISNDIQQFKIGDYQFYCKPYGVFTIDELYKEAKLDSTCKKTISSFYAKRKDLLHYAESKMKIMQSYPLKYKNNRCIINVEGEKSLSEFLLQEGLALKKPKLEDKEYEYYLFKAQYEAKITKKGIWKKNIIRECVSNIYK
ncbi:thermonuclease family protein [Sulfurimonas sp.]